MDGLKLLKKRSALISSVKNDSISFVNYKRRDNMENRREFVDHEERYGRIKCFIEENGPSMIKPIAQAVGLNNDLTYQELKKLTETGRIIVTKDGRRNIYSLPGEASETPVPGDRSKSTVTPADYDNKECGGCGEVKSREEFGPGETYCRDCNRERVRKARAEDKEEKLPWQTPELKENPHLSEEAVKKFQEYLEENPDLCSGKLELWPRESTPEIWMLSRILPMLFKAKVFTIKTTEYKVTAAYSDHNTLIEAYTNLPVDLQEKTKITIDQSRDACRLTIPLEG